MAITTEERDSIHDLVEESKVMEEIARKLSDHLRRHGNDRESAEKVRALLPMLDVVEVGT